ncbi:MAG: hypothetical protein GY701_03245, partial [Sulfitobacter sp.]|nr:hypothetical protein [Sulfitobacter sp.]
TNATISGIAAGGSSSNRSDAVRGSVVYNAIGNAPDVLGIIPAVRGYGTDAYLKDADVAGSVLISIDASEISTIDAIAGALAKSSRGGYGGAFAINAIGNDVGAVIDNSSVVTPGVLIVNAVSDATIDAFAGAIAKGEEDAFAGALAWNDIVNVTEALIMDGKSSGAVVEAGLVSLSAEDDSLIDSFAGAIGNSKNRAIGAAVGVNEMANRTLAGIANTVVTTPTVDISANAGTAGDANLIDTWVAGLALGGGDAISVSVAINDIANTTEAFVTDNSEIKDTLDTDVLSLDLNAENYSKIDVFSVSITNSNSGGSGGNTRVNQDPFQHLAPGGNSGFGIDLSLDVALNGIHDNTRAYIDNNSEVAITGPASLSALSDSTIEVLAGAVQLTDPNRHTNGNTGGSGDVFGVAGVFSMNQLDGETAAYIDNATVTTGDALSLDARRVGTVDAIAVAWKSGSKVGLAGAATYNDIQTSTVARLRNNAKITSGGMTSVIASDTVDLFSLAGALSTGATRGGVGAGIAINEVARSTRVVIDNTDAEVGGLVLDAHTGGITESWAVSVEKAPAGLSGTLTFNRFNDETLATIENGRGTRSVMIDGDADIAARNTVKAFSLSGAGAISQSSGGGGGSFPDTSVGVAVAYNEMGPGNRTVASIENATVRTNPAFDSFQSIRLAAKTDAAFEAFAIAGAIDGDFTIAGSVVINSLAGLTEAVIDNSDVYASENLLVLADNLIDVDSLAGAAAISFGSGSQSVGVGGAVTVNQFDTQTRARIEDSNGAQDGFTRVSALGNGIFNLAYNGEFLDGTRFVEPIAGIGLVASSSMDVNSVNAALSKDDLALGAAVSVNMVNDVASAKIETGVAVNPSNSDASESQEVRVVAGNHHLLTSNDWVVAITDQDAAVGAAVDYTHFGKTTEVRVTDALVNARRRVAIRANSDEDLETVAIGGGLGDGTAGLAGSVSIAEFASTTDASVDGGNIATPGDVEVAASDDSSANMVAGGFTVGNNTVGVGGSVVYLESKNKTNAYIEGGAEVDASGQTRTKANSTQDFNTIAIAGAAGGGDLAVAGAVSVKNLNSSTISGIREGASINQDPLLTALEQDVLLTSQSDLFVNGVATGVQLGGDLGIGAAVDVNLINDTVLASIEDEAEETKVAGRDIDVSAKSRKDTGSVAIAGNVSERVSLSGAVAVTSVSGGINQDMFDAIGDLGIFGPGASSSLQAPALPNLPGVTPTVNNTMTNTTPVASVVQPAIPLPLSGTTARVGVNATTIATRDINVEALLESDNDLVAGDISFSKDAEIGAGVSFLTLRDETRADIAGPDQVRAGRDVRVEAGESAVSNKVTVLGDNDTSTVAGFSGGAASARVGGGVVYVDKGNKTLATISDSNDLPVEALAGSINVLSHSAGLINSTAIGVTLSGNDLSGAVIVNNLHNITEARVLRSTLRADDNVLVFADAANGLELFGGKFSLPSGVELGGTLTTVISDNETRAFINDNADVWAGANGDAMTIDSGQIGDPVVLAPIGEADLDKQAGAPEVELIKGVGVVATSVNNLDHVAISGSLGGSVGVAASVAASFIDDTVESYIGSVDFGGVEVNDPGVGLSANNERQVRVAAGNHTATNALAGIGSIGGAGGAGGAINLVTFAKETRAFIDNTDGVYTEQRIGVDAVSSEQQSSVAIAGELGSTSGLAGAAGIVVLDNITEARITASTVKTPGDLTVHAQNDAELDLLTGGIALTSSLGVGAGLDIIELSSETRAFIADIDGVTNSIDAGGTLEIDADSSNDIFDIAMAGSASTTAAIAGGVSIKSVETITEASLAADAKVNQDDNFRGAQQDVIINAHDELTIRGAAGAVAAAVSTSLGGAVGAGIDVVVVNDRVAAAAGVDSEIDAGRDVRIESTADKSISSLAIGASLGLLAGSGAVSTVVLGSGQQSDAAIGIGALLDEFDGGVDRIASDYLVNPIRDQIGLSQTGQNASTRTPDLSNLSRHLKSGATVPNDSLTLAAVGAGADINAGRDVRIAAANRTDVTSTAGNGTGAALGVGAGIAVVSAGNDVEANVGAGAMITADNDIVVRSKYLGMPAQQIAGQNITTAAYGGALGGIVGQVSLSHAELDPMLDAYAGIDSTLAAGNNLFIETEYDIEQKADAVALALGLVTGAAADARSFANPESRARLESRAVVEAVKVSIANRVSGSSVATPVAASVTVGGASYVRAEAEGAPLAHAYAGDGVMITASGQVDIASRGSFETRAAASGGTGGAAIAVTDMTSYATGEADFRAWVDGGNDRATVTGVSVEIVAEKDDSGSGFTVIAENEANATIGGLTAISPVETVAHDKSNFEAYISGNSEVIAPGGAVVVGSGAPVLARATLKGGGGSIGVSYNEPRAEAIVDTTFASYIDGDHDSEITDVSGSTVTVEAGGRGAVESRSSITGVSIGLAGAVNDVVSTATNNARMDAYIQGRAKVEAADLLLLDPAIRVLAGSDTVADAGADGGSGSLLIASNYMTVNATDNSQFNAYVRGNTDYQTLVRTAPAWSGLLSDGIEIRAEGDIDVDAHVDGGGSVGLIGAENVMSVTASSNARRESFVDGNARVDARSNNPASLFKFGDVTIASGGDIEIDAKLGGGSGSLAFSGSDLRAMATDNSVFFASISGDNASNVTTEVFADNGVTVQATGGSGSLDDGVHVMADIVGMSFSAIAADNYPGGTATANTQMASRIRGNADVNAGGGVLRVLAGDSVDVQSNIDAGSGALVVAVDRPTATATGNVHFNAAVDGSNADYDTLVTGNRVEVGAAGGPAGIYIGALINGGAGGGINANGLASANSNDDSLLDAYVRGNSEVTAIAETGANFVEGGHVDVYSESDVEVSAEVNAGTGSIVVAVDSPDAIATTRTIQRASITGGTEQTSVSGSTVAVSAGGRLINDAGTIREIKSTVSTMAEINTGAGSVLATIGESTVKATDESVFDAHVAGNVSVSVERLGLGLVRVGAIADAQVSSTLNTGGGSVGVNVGASDVDALGKSMRKAYVDGAGSTVIIDAKTLEVIASARDILENSQGDITDWGLTVNGLVNGGGGAGAVNVGATTLDAKDESTVSAYLTNGVVTGTDLLSARVEASGDVNVRAEQNGGGGGGLVSVEAPKTTAIADTDIKAWTGGAGNTVTVNANDLDVVAGGWNNAVTVSAEMNGGSGGGLVGVSDTDATAKDLTRFEAYLDQGSIINLSQTSGDLNIVALSSGSATSVLRGGTGSGLVNVDVPTVTATGDSTLNAYIDGSLGPVSVTTRNLDVEAGSGQGGLLADVLLTGGGGAGLVGVGVSTATATQSSAIDARIKGDVHIDASGKVSVVSSSGDIVAKSEISTGSGAGAVNVEVINTNATNEVDFDAVIEALDGAVPTIGAHDLFVWAGASASDPSSVSGVSGPNSRDPVMSNVDSILGTGSGAGLVSVSEPTAKATDSMTVLARAGGKLTLSNDLFVIATSEVDLFSKPTGETVGLISGNQGAHAQSTGTGSTEARLATDCFGVPDCAKTIAGGNITITSEAGADIDSESTAGAGGFIATSNSTATSKLNTKVYSVIGDGENIETVGDLVMNATTPLTWATSSSYAESGGAGVGVTSHSISDIDLDFSVTIGDDASIDAEHVYATVDASSVWANTDAQVNFGAAGASVDIVSRSTVNTQAVVTQRSGSVIHARDGVTYRAEADANPHARAVKGGHAIDGGSVVSEALPVLYAKIDFQDDAKIYTYDVDFESNVTNVTTYTVAHNNSSTITPVESGYIDPLAEVFVDGDIIMLNSLPQHLVIHDDGAIETVSGEISAQLVGNEVVVDDLVNDRVGSVRLVANADIDQSEQDWIDSGFCDGGNIFCDLLGWDSDNLFSALGNGRVRGTTGTLQYDNSYPYVLIENHSIHDLVVNDIIISTHETAAPTFILDSDNTRFPDYLDWITLRQTVTDLLDINSEFVGTYDHHLPSRYYLLTDDTTSINFVSDDLVKPISFGALSVDRLEFVGTDGDSSIRVFNTTDADVIFKGRVDSEGQSGSIGLFNESGNLLAGNDEAIFETSDFTAYAYGGYIGGAYDFDVDLVKADTIDPMFTAFAKDGLFISPRLVTYGDGPVPAMI